MLRPWATPFAAGLLVGVLGTATAAAVRGSDVFPDVPRGSYYDDAVGDMYDAGVIKGNPDGTFDPGAFVTRADVAVMLQRLRDDLTGNVDRDDDEDDDRSSSSRSSSRSSASSSSSHNPKGALRFTTTELRVPENVSTKKITVAVVRTGGNDGTVTVEYATGGGTANEGTDYEKASGTLTFDNKETSQTFDIQIKDDGSSEGDETVTITLSEPGNGVSLGTPATATLIITDNESSGGSSSSSSATSSASSGPSVGFSAVQYSIDEDMGTLTVTVARSGSTSGTASVQYATSNGTGKSGSEYTSTSGTLNFGGGESSKTFTVAIANDSGADGTKTFNLTLSNPTGASIASGLGSATVTINDDESVDFGSGSFKFSRSSYTATESSGKAEVIVQRTGGSTFTASVNYSTTAINASGADYTHTSGTLTFAPGEAAKIITIPVAADSVADTGETFAVDLTSPTNGVPLIDPYSTTVTIE